MRAANPTVTQAQNVACMPEKIIETATASTRRVPSLILCTRVVPPAHVEQGYGRSTVQNHSGVEETPLENNALRSL